MGDAAVTMPSGEDTTQQAPEGLEHLLEVSKRSKVLISAVNTPRDGLYPTQLRQIHPYSSSLAEHRKVPVKLPEISRKDCTFQLSFILYWQH